MEANLTDDEMRGHFKISQSNQTKTIRWNTDEGCHSVYFHQQINHEDKTTPIRGRVHSGQCSQNFPGKIASGSASIRSPFACQKQSVVCNQWNIPGLKCGREWTPGHVSSFGVPRT